MTRLALTDEEFAALRTLLARAAGLVFDDARRDSLAYCVAERLRATGSGTVAGYLDLLEDPDERQLLLDEVTIQETHFFRNPPQVRALRQHVLPGLVRAAEARGHRRLRVWSAGCSTGEEAYTVAMLLREALPAARGWDVRVLATDVSVTALAAARTARYGARAVQMAAPEDLARWFVPVGRGGYEVRPEVRELVELRHHNLVTDPLPVTPGEIDLVLCRNVTIYFGRDTTRALVSRFHSALRDTGYLLLGHSETLWQVSQEFRLVPLGTGDSAAFVYRRLDSTVERRRTLPDRRTGQDGTPAAGPERRRGSRRIVEVPRGAAATIVLPVVDQVPQVRAALAQGRYEDAVALADAAVARDPLRADAHYLRGLALVDLARDGEALLDLRKAVYLAPEDGFAHFLLAGVLARLGDHAAARREYRAAATTLGRRAGDDRADELGGRSVAELAALCARLGRESS